MNLKSHEPLHGFFFTGEGLLCNWLTIIKLSVSTLTGTFIMGVLHGSKMTEYVHACKDAPPLRPWCRTQNYKLWSDS